VGEPGGLWWPGVAAREQVEQPDQALTDAFAVRPNVRPTAATRRANARSTRSRATPASAAVVGRLESDGDRGLVQRGVAPPSRPSS
jgi:hypothetical protein